jgi:hypothetical protein
MKVRRFEDSVEVKALLLSSCLTPLKKGRATQIEKKVVQCTKQASNEQRARAAATPFSFCQSQRLSPKKHSSAQRHTQPSSPSSHNLQPTSQHSPVCAQRSFTRQCSSADSALCSKASGSQLVGVSLLAYFVAGRSSSSQLVLKQQHSLRLGWERCNVVQRCRSPRMCMHFTSNKSWYVSCAQVARSRYVSWH